MAHPLYEHANSIQQDQQLYVVRSATEHYRQLLLEPGFPYGEDLLQFIWETRLFDQHGLRTIEGDPIEVIKAGRIQRNSGPDLADAEIRIGGQLWAGTVEVHLRSSEWNAHGHQFDPAYENVVLHVVYEHDQEVHTLAGRSLPTVELLPRVSTDSIALHHKLMSAQGFVPCASQIAQVDQGKVGPWLERVLIERLERKTLEVEALFERTGRDPAETFYHMLLQAFGMKVNAEPFAMLANALPLKIVQKYRDDELRTEALLFGQAGLLRVDLIDEHPRSLQREHAMLSHKHGLTAAPLAAWKFGRIRPVNFPTLRIAQFKELFIRCDGDLGRLLSFDDVKDIHSLLDVEATGYWQDHHRFDHASKTSPKRAGRVVADHIIINAIVPTLFALGRAMGRPDLQDRALYLLEQLPAEKNQLLESWAQLGLKAGCASRGQALIELRNVYCAARRCLSCGFGNELLKRTSPARTMKT